MIKKMKIGKTKSKDEKSESDVPSKIFNISSPFLFSFFLAFFSNIFVFVFPIEIKMRGFFVGGNEKELENYRMFSSLFSTSFNMFFLKRDKKGDVYVGVVMGKN